MSFTLTAANAAALFAAMAVLAATPSVSVLTVSARAAEAGFVHGVFAAAGIVLADVLFILFAIFGLVLLAEALDELFVVIRLLGGLLLIWMGLRFWTVRSNREARTSTAPISRSSSFLAGFFITLGDQKAILFYFGFFPAFLDLKLMSALDAGIVVAIAVLAVGGVKLVYAWLAAEAGHRVGPGIGRLIRWVAGSVLIAVGVYLLVGLSPGFSG
ncbi:MAG: LysE family translocator [Ectothiorhodospiraceae bacterium]|jgi:threonine/homoserine/homoserine lactone efflux protein|nr:LysE family translocator [Ectothiorhodospiraceae bacterium]